VTIDDRSKLLCRASVAAANAAIDVLRAELGCTQDDEPTLEAVENAASALEMVCEQLARTAKVTRQILEPIGSA